MRKKHSIFNFYEKFDEIIESSSGLLEEANLNLMTILCTSTLNTLKKVISTNGFVNKEEEIYFFKNIKVVPMKYLIYYTEVRSCELRFPKIGKSNQMLYLEKQIDKTNSFFSKHTEFLIYIDEEHEHFDKHYFTRKHLHRAPVVKSYPYYKDPSFNTSHDGILARIRAMDLFINYLRSKKMELEKENSSIDKQRTVKWTGSYAAFIEMIYGCDAMSYFNDGNIEISTIIDELGDFLNVPKGNYTRTYNELKNRLKSRIKFFEEAGEKLKGKMNKEDGQFKN